MPTPDSSMMMVPQPIKKCGDKAHGLMAKKGKKKCPACGSKLEVSKDGEVTVEKADPQRSQAAKIAWQKRQRLLKPKQVATGKKIKAKKKKGTWEGRCFSGAFRSSNPGACTQDPRRG